MVLGAGAAVENIFPPIPADTFVLLGAFLAQRTGVNLWMVFAVTWCCNIISALGVYGLARRWGPQFFEHGIGHFLLKPHQMRQVDGFYRRWGTMAILVSRFLPAFRAIVPVFAGVSGMTLLRVTVPLALASGAWYGGLIVLGSVAGRNWEAILRVFGQISGWLAVLAGVLIAAFVYWWWRSRRAEE